MPPSADDSVLFNSMLLPSPPVGMGQKADRYFGKNVRSLSFNGQMHAMPAIPEDNEVSTVHLSGQQKVMDLLLFALDGNFSENETPVDGSGSPEDGFFTRNCGLSGGGSTEMKKVSGKGTERLDVVEVPGVESTPTKPSVAHAGWGLSFLQKNGCKIFQSPEVDCEVSNENKHASPDLEKGQVQSKPRPPILTVGSGGLPSSSTANSFGWQQNFYKSVVLLVFFLINLEIAGILAVTGLFVGGAVVGGVILGCVGLVFLVVFIFNLCLRRMRRMILQKYLSVKVKAKLSDLETLPHGVSVVVRGKVSSVNSQLVSSDLQHVERCLLVETCLQSQQAKGGRFLKCKQHVQQTRAVSFRITDEETGATAVVNASYATSQGLLVPILRMATAVPLTGNLNLHKWLGVQQAKVMQSVCDNAQLTLHEGYVCEGDVVTVVGLLNKAGNVSVIEPMTQAKNVSKLLFFWNILPFYYPTWVSGLVISNEV